MMKRKLSQQQTESSAASKGCYHKIPIMTSTTTTTAKKIHYSILLICMSSHLLEGFNPESITRTISRPSYSNEQKQNRRVRYRSSMSSSIFVLKEPERVLFTDDNENGLADNDKEEETEEYLVINTMNGERRYTTTSKPPLQQQQQLLQNNIINVKDDSFESSNQEGRSEVFQTTLAATTTNAVVLDRNNPEYRYSVSDWLPIMCLIFQSSTLRYTRGPVITIMIWSAILSTIQSIMEHFHSSYIQYIYTLLPTTVAHSTTVSVLGLLLVFRTTSAYQKFDEGRLIWERILSLCRNVTRQVMLYPEFTTYKKIRIVQLLASYPYFLYHHIKAPTTRRSKITKASTSRTDNSNSILHRLRFSFVRKKQGDSHQQQHESLVQSSSVNCGSSSDGVQQQAQPREKKIISNELPWSLFLHDKNVNNSSYNRSIIQRLMKVENRPLYILDKIGEEIMQVSYSNTYTSMERTVLLSFLNELTEAVSECERIHRTTVPLNYARHSLRALTVWLFTLPITLLESYQWWTVPIMGLTAWLYYGIYQIGYSIEDPFQSTIRLTSICDTIYRDVICDEHRSSAFDVSLSGDDDGEWKDLPL